MPTCEVRTWKHEELDQLSYAQKPSGTVLQPDANCCLQRMMIQGRLWELQHNAWQKGFKIEITVSVVKSQGELQKHAWQQARRLEE